MAGWPAMNLQTAILALAPRHRATPRVPVLGAGNAPEEITFDSDGAMLVWDGASEATIYRDPKVNHAFRAWHDAQHIRARAGFTLAGERIACERQCRELQTRFPGVPERVLRLIRAEVIGQAEYFAQHGSFPIDQAKFIEEYLS
jgi:hypothetical protein